jgi:hypothetical protein
MRKQICPAYIGPDQMIVLLQTSVLQIRIHDPICGVFFTSWIQDSDPGWTFYGSEIRDPDPGLIILLTVKTCTWTIRSTKKVSFYFSSFFSCRIRDPGYKKKIIIRIRDPEWKFLDPDPQHCLRCSSAWGETF